MRMVLDTNVLVSGLLFPGGTPSRLVKAWRGGAFDLVISDFVIDELQRTWTHLAPRLKATPNDLADFIDTLGLRAELLRVDAAMHAQAGVASLRDPDDVPVLALLIGSGADCLITGDQDLLALASDYPILSPSGFMERFMP
jgi:putative PIN family toxin of toxin-antitoxin system